MWLRWLGALVLGVTVDAFGLITVPLALLAVKYHEAKIGDRVNHLPVWAWPWDNDEAVYGINGGYAWMRQYDQDAFTFWRRFTWLALRNPSHNFAYYVLGRPAKNCLPADLNFTNDQWQAVEDHGGFGVFEVKEWISADTLWRFWPQVFVHNRLVYIRIGWQNNNSTDIDARCRFSCVIRKGHIKAA